MRKYPNSTCEKCKVRGHGRVDGDAIFLPTGWVMLYRDLGRGRLGAEFCATCAKAVLAAKKPVWQTNQFRPYQPK